MSSAFAELGVCDEIVQGLDKIGWALPTDIQAEAVPLILGGGDVLMAAETGSGKTGAFCLPVIQIVNESKREKEPKSSSSRTPAGSVTCKLSMEERSDIVAVSPDGLQMQCRDFRIWGGCRSTWATKENAIGFYEVSCNDEGLSRFGFGTISCDLNLGTCPQGFGFGGTGKKSNRRQFDSYGEPFGQGDIIGCLIDRQRNEITFFKNGKDLGVAFQIPNSMNTEPLYAICCLKNAEVAVNFDGPFKFPPESGNVTAFGKLGLRVEFRIGKLQKNRDKSGISKQSGKKGCVNIFIRENRGIFYHYYHPKTRFHCTFCCWSRSFCEDRKYKGTSNGDYPRAFS